MIEINNIQKLLASLPVKSSVFIHPALKIVDELKAIHNRKTFIPFEILGVDYFIEELKSTVDIDEQTPYSIYMRDGNIIHESQTYLFEWQWQYLVNGADIVNSDEYYVVSGIGNKKKYISAHTREKLIRIKRKEAEKNQNFDGLRVYLEEHSMPVNILSDGTWVSR
ncbi:hypothetical protein [Photobacterium kishitanii]|uniref:Uncharacterized protein n=1 Tax=Photobacterium kishitanii TaxID=318456 RepID=A0A2T3KKX2_9GAMM|nr:hypothetical protein [Photobacterium kishitanii]PSV00303.1 hypothetical protein C9J27_04045 [Photobacterium kishitanii]